MKNFWRVMISLSLTAAVLAGCGAAEKEEEKASVEEAAETPAAETAEEMDGTSVAEEEAEGAPETLAPDPTNLIYLEEYQIEDVFGDGKEYSLYAPKGGQNTDGFFFYSDHGITFTASIYSGGSLEELQMYLDMSVDLQVEDWKEDQECSEVGVGETLAKGDDRYLFLTAKKKDFNGAIYQRRKLIYMSVRDGGAGVFWEMELSENAQDEETSPLIAEVARCYGLNLGEFSMEDGTWAEQDAKLEAERQNVYEPEEGEIVLEKVEGYQYLGMATIAMDDEGEVTCPVLVPMGRNTTVDENRASTTIHGVSMWVRGDHTPYAGNYQAMAQKDADYAQDYYNDLEYGYRNGKVSEVMPMPGQEAAAYYFVEYEQKDSLTEEYNRRTYIDCLIQVKERHYISCEIRLLFEDYDVETNDLLKELETAYGLDLSAWYAVEDLSQTEE